LCWLPERPPQWGGRSGRTGASARAADCMNSVSGQARGSVQAGAGHAPEQPEAQTLVWSHPNASEWLTRPLRERGVDNERRGGSGGWLSLCRQGATRRLAAKAQEMADDDRSHPQQTGWDGPSSTARDPTGARGPTVARHTTSDRAPQVFRRINQFSTHNFVRASVLAPGWPHRCTLVRT